MITMDMLKILANITNVYTGDEGIETWVYVLMGVALICIVLLFVTRKKK